MKGDKASKCMIYQLQVKKYGQHFGEEYPGFLHMWDSLLGSRLRPRIWCKWKPLLWRKLLFQVRMLNPTKNTEVHGFNRLGVN